MDYNNLNADEEVARVVDAVERGNFRQATKRESMSVHLATLSDIFMRQFDSGCGDYAKERHAWLDGLTIEDIASEIKNKQASAS